MDEDIIKKNNMGIITNITNKGYTQVFFSSSFC